MSTTPLHSRRQIRRSRSDSKIGALARALRWFPRPALCAATLAVALAATPLVTSCGESANGSEFTTSCQAYPDRCGAPCSEDTACGDGLYCSDAGKCNADCTPGGEECGPGLSCTPAGHCGAGSQSTAGVGGGLGVGSGGTGGAGVGGSCPDVVVEYEKQIPTVILLIDQSGSMTEGFGNGNRWNVLRDALLDPGSGVISTLEDEVRFGLALYSSENGFEGGVCPRLVEVGIALGNYGAIASAYAAADPLDDTPTGDSITAVTTALAAFAEPGPKVIVLATDGEPDTCEQADPQDGQAESIAAAQAAHALGIETRVISVGADTSLAHLQDVANAGVGLPIGGATDAPYYLALDQAALVTAFEEIINGVRTCIFNLDGTVPPENASQGVVVLDGEPLGYQDPDGWKQNGPSEIEITGAACDALQSGDHTLTVTFPCGTVEPPR
jgi:hypothetical protein